MTEVLLHIFLLDLAVKKFSKSANICQSYAQD